MILRKLFLLCVFSAFITACGGGTQVTQASPPVVSRTISNVVAFMGDSETQYWNIATNDSAPTINFGVAGQTTAQMLARFNDEVIASAPGVVVIQGGINDIFYAVDDPSAPPATIDSIKAMAAMATGAGIKVILCSVTPINTQDAPASVPAAIENFNGQLLALAKANGYLYADYYDQMVNADDTQNTSLFLGDIGHPNIAGYAVMWSVLKPLLDEDLT